MKYLKKIDGSAKEIKILKKASNYELGVADFHFLKTYSVFDWGRMPETIKNKDYALAMMGGYNFELLEDAGFKTHYSGMINSEEKVVSVHELIDNNELSRIMRVQLAQVLSIKNSAGVITYEAYKDKDNPPRNFLLPVEVIVRNGLPEGSSVFKRLRKAETTSEKQDILNNYGLTEEPKPGCMLPKPVLEFTSKLEETDRPMIYEEVINIIGKKRFDQCFDLSLEANNIITGHARKQGIKRWDSKIELICAGNDDVWIADVVGTLDEDRFSWKEIQVSKQPLRDFNKKFNQKWYEAVEKAKEIAKEKSEDDWKKYCKINPNKLGDELIGLISQSYQGLTNEWISKRIFPEAKSLDDVLPSIHQNLKADN